LSAFLAAERRRCNSAAAGDAKEGHRLALKICYACHVVASDQPYPPILRHPAPKQRSSDGRRVALQP
jgi:cytochrome c2